VPREFRISGVTLERLRENHPDIDDRLADPGFQNALGATTQASNFLTRLVLSDPLAIEVIANLDERRSESSDDVDALVRWKRLELLRIAARDLSGLDQLEIVGYNLARLGEEVLLASSRLAGTQDDLVIIGMGKLGGKELNYASDVDLMFAGEPDDEAARRVLDIARQCFRVDTALRPEGRDGPLVRSLDSFERYWAEFAQPWEFQALLKARPLCGPDDAQLAWSQAASQSLWSHTFNADELRNLRDMKARVEQLVASKGLDKREVKRGRGGIRDIEFAVQLLQLVHGGADEHIRSATTLTALEQLSDGGYIDTQDSVDLAESYKFLRAVEHRLQLVEEEQTHTIPTSIGGKQLLASALGYDGDNALAQFEDQLRACQTIVRHAHERLYFRPLLEAFAADSIEPGSTAETQLAAFGFTDANRTRTAVEELTRGLARSSRLMQQLMPLLLDWLSSSPDPDEGLLGLRKLIAGFRTPAHIVNVFRDSPEVARRLCLLLGTGRVFGRDIVQHPEVLDDLGDDTLLVPSAPYFDRMQVALSWRHDSESRRDAFLRLARAERLRIACADVLGIISDAEAAERRSSLADAVLELALEAVEPDIPVALIAMGRYGGSELGYGSDLDLIVIHDGHSSTEQLEAERVAQQLIQDIGAATPTNKLYDIDYSLRPEGRKGLLARNMEGCADYYGNWASTWERQALIRQRFAAGNKEVAKKFEAIVQPFVWQDGLTPEMLREIRHLKARMERERIPRGGDPEFHLKLGPGSLSDVEWTVQQLQLQHNVEGTNTLEVIDALTHKHHLDERDARVLREAWQFCDSTRNRLYLVADAPSDALPANLHTLAVLARSMGIPELRDRYKQVTRRCRAVTERLFYGQEMN
jgi:[glutamine synthetase] adenylyltransferase / [glutamine synthetase]-adenylyl-L-tyrosine phosphorylase